MRFTNALKFQVVEGQINAKFTILHLCSRVSCQMGQMQWKVRFTGHISKAGDEWQFDHMTGHSWNVHESDTTVSDNIVFEQLGIWIEWQTEADVILPESWIIQSWQASRKTAGHKQQSGKLSAYF